MPTKTGKPYATFYGNDLQVSRTSNTGIDTTTRSIEDGLGDATAISLSDDVLQVQPQNDNTTGAFIVKNQGGSTILSVDTQTTTGSSAVKCGSSQINALTQYKDFS